MHGGPAARMWRVRLRFTDARVSSRAGWPAMSDWLEAVLPDVGAVRPVDARWTGDGPVVSLHVHARSRPQAIAVAGDLIEVVVGDTARVLGRMVASGAAPGPGPLE